MTQALSDHLSRAPTNSMVTDASLWHIVGSTGWFAAALDHYDAERFSVLAGQQNWEAFAGCLEESAAITLVASLKVSSTESLRGSA